MAVTVEGISGVLLDEEYRVVEVTPAAARVFGRLLGDSLWDHFPDARHIFLPYGEEARRTGEPVEFIQFYDGTLLRIGAVPRGHLLAVSWRALGTIDVSTLESLRDSLLGIVGALAEQEAPLSARRRPTLRVLEGGAGAPRPSDAQGVRETETEPVLDRG